MVCYDIYSQDLSKSFQFSLSDLRNIPLSYQSETATLFSFKFSPTITCYHKLHGECEWSAIKDIFLKVSGSFLHHSYFFCFSSNLFAAGDIPEIVPVYPYQFVGYQVFSSPSFPSYAAFWPNYKEPLVSYTSLINNALPVFTPDALSQNWNPILFPYTTSFSLVSGGGYTLQATLEFTEGNLPV